MTCTKQLRCLVFLDEKNTKKPSSQAVLLDSLDKFCAGLDDFCNIFKNYSNGSICKTSSLKEQQLKKEALQAVNREAARAFARLTTVHKQLKDNNIYNKDKKGE